MDKYILIQRQFMYVPLSFNYITIKYPKYIFVEIKDQIKVDEQILKKKFC